MTNWNYDSIHCVPRELSKVPSRDRCDMTVEAFGQALAMPLIPAPMDRVCNGDMALALAKQHMLGIIHCKQSIESQVAEYAKLPNNFITACAIGVTKDYKERFLELLKKGCRIFCLDTANGFNETIEKAYKSLYRVYPYHTSDRVWFIGGNVASKEGFRYLAHLSFDAIRVGVSGGSVCTTKTETGVYAPTLFSVNECKEWRDQYAAVGKPLIIADGGIKRPEDMIKALILGADLVMAGNIFAGTDEAPGDIEFDAQGVGYKTYRGSASFATQLEVTGKKPKYVEGMEMKVKATGPVADLIERFQGGLRSSMSWHNALTLKEFRANAKKSLLFT
jgi:IMP dehydrogenase